MTGGAAMMRCDVTESSKCPAEMPTDKQLIAICR
jgi:hypothetical protein